MVKTKLKAIGDSQIIQRNQKIQLKKIDQS